MKENNVILEKSKSFAIRIVKLCKYLNDRNEYVLSKQLLRSASKYWCEYQRGTEGTE